MNNPPLIIHAVRHGFTLIELMISIALGSMVVYTAIAGFRVASTSITLVNRLALENAIMRSGFVQAHERVDFWTDADNPQDLNQQGLRNKSTTVNFLSGYPGRKAAESASGYQSGLPFSDMADVFPQPSPPVAPGLNPSATELARESNKGWNAKDRWLMNESRTWFHGDLSDNINGNKAGGYYSIFTNIFPSLDLDTLSGYSWNFPASGGGTRSLQEKYGVVTPRHNWLMGQTRAMHQALGFYAFADYMPANHIYAAYGKVKAWNGDEMNNVLGTDANGTLAIISMPGLRFTQSPQWWGFIVPGIPNDLARLTFNGAFAMVSPDYNVESTSTMIKANNAKINNGKNPLTHQFKYSLGYCPERNDVAAMDYNQGNLTTATGAAHYSGNWQLALHFQRFLNVTEMTTPVIPGGGPAQWPKATVTIKRYVLRSRFANMCSVRWTSPVTGQAAEINFTTFGSSLRGARQQRKSQPIGASVAAGWANWDGPDLSTNDKTLDGDL